MNSKKVLYISYDGMCEPLGQSQVLNYVTRLSANWSFELLSFEKPEDYSDESSVSKVQKICTEHKVAWKPMPYHRHPSLLATIYDIIVAWVYIIKQHRRSAVGIVHCRSYVAALMGMPLRIFFKVPLIFDMRGFWADEKVDSGSWKRGWFYSFVKLLEKYFLRKSDHIISLTQKAVDEINFVSKEKFSVIPTCVAMDQFNWAPDSPDSFVLGYVGGTRLWYDFPKVLGLFNALLVQKPQAKLHIVNKGEHEYIQNCLNFAEIPSDCVRLEERTHSEMAEAYKNFSFGVFFIKDFYSKKASMPTKLAEFMATGVPVITGQGIGDVDFYIKKYNTGVLIGLDPSEQDMQDINKLAQDPQVRARCRDLADKEFNLEIAIEKLNSIYRHLSSQD